MPAALIAVADINTLWRFKPFQALSLHTEVLGVMPRDVLTALRNRKCADESGTEAPIIQVPVMLPPGWASLLMKWTAPFLWSRIQAAAKKQGGVLRSLVLTSPHYLELAKRASHKVTTFYYCSDDYSQYAGWGGEAALKKEAQLAQCVSHSFFVSQVLADRAVHEYGISADRVSVSPNATDVEAMTRVNETQINDLFQAFPALRRPLVGVVGGINDRLDFDVLASCADLSEVGSLVMVGSVDTAYNNESLSRLRSHPKCVFAGQQPHSKIPIWMQALDVALIPYRDTPLNRACSPMRLYDHLAAGRPMVATDCCDQVNAFHELIHITDRAPAFVKQVAEMCRQARPEVRLPSMLSTVRKHTWDVRARNLTAVFSENRP